MEDTLKKILAKLDKMDARFDNVDNRLDKMDNRLDKMDNRLGTLEEGQGEVKGELRTINRKLDAIYEQVAKNTELEAKLAYRFKRAFAEE